jgi:hypothetical protein
MAGAEREQPVSARRAPGRSAKVGAALISVDGVSGTAAVAGGRAALAAVADDEAGAPSARTLLLLYAADLAFRLRWEIRPALAEGRVVVAAPYVDTAVALGRAAGLPSGWLTNLFGFAPPAADSRYVDVLPTRTATADAGLLEFAWRQKVCLVVGLGRRELFEKTRAHLRILARRAGSSPSAGVMIVRRVRR